MNTVLMFVIMGLVCQVREAVLETWSLTYSINIYKLYTHKACNFQNLKLPTALGFCQN